MKDETCHDLMKWTESGDRFTITNTIGFMENILPKYFKHQNFASFVRQLNMYGFKKSKDSKD